MACLEEETPPTTPTKPQRPTSLKPEESSDRLEVCFVNEAAEADLEGERWRKTLQSPNLEDLSAQYIARNNISRKKSHVIVPLTPTTQINNVDGLREEEQEEKEEEDRKEKRLAVHLRQIRAEARENLDRAKAEAKESMRRHREASSTSLLRDLTRLLGVNNDRNRKLSRRMLTDMNIGQLQVILNFLLSRIEGLNEKLVSDLMARDELVMEQDSLLTDIEDITKATI